MLIITSGKFKLAISCILCFFLFSSCDNEQNIDDCGEKVLELLAEDYSGFNFISRNDSVFCFSDILFASMVLKNETSEKRLRVLIDVNCDVQYEACQIDSLPERIANKLTESIDLLPTASWLYNSKLSDDLYLFEFIDSTSDIKKPSLFINANSLSTCSK